MTYAPESAPYEEKNSSLLSNILAIAGFLIVAAVIIWGLAHLASLSRSWLSSLFSSKAAAIEVSAPATTTASSPFTLSWNYAPKTSGSYALLYQCQVGLRVRTPGSTGSMNDIPCGASFDVGAKKSVSLTPQISGVAEGQALTVPFSILFLPTATSSAAQAQGSAVVAIVSSDTRASSVNTISTKPVSQSTASTHSARSYSGLPNLAVRINSVSDEGGVAAVTFTIENTGTSPSGAYYFTAQLPAIQQYTYTSPTQTSLVPGAYVINTLRFSHTSGGLFSISVDPSNTITESNESDNSASQSIGNATYYPTNSYNYTNYIQPYNPTYQYYPPYPYQYQVSPTYSQEYPTSTYYPYTY